MVHRYATFIKAVNLVIDYFILNVSMVLAYVFVNQSIPISLTNNHYLPVVLVFNLVWFLSANVSGLYSGVLNKDSIVTYRNMFRTYLIFVGLICVTIFIIIGTQAYFVTREYLFYSLAIFGFLIGLWKLIFLSIRKGDRNVLISKRNIVIVGASRVGADIYSFLKSNPDRGYQPIGFFDNDATGSLMPELLLGTTDACMPYVLNNKIHEIFCALPSSESIVIEHLMREADQNMIRFKIVPEYFSYNNRTTIVQSFGSIPVISIRPEPLESLLNRSIKRLFDICFSIFIVVFVLSWMLPLLALLIKLESKGPVFFIQSRSGRENQKFNCYKFRSMRVNEDSDVKQASRNDYRITTIGAFMRRTNLDELPQFFNVLMGDMSVVGPRPHMISHTEEYSKMIEKYMVRHFLKPGITGWAQVRGYRGETKDTTAMVKRIEHDVWYLENWSFLLDMKIIFLTLWVTVIGDDNAF